MLTIYRYFGWHADPEGLTLAEASEGNLQQYLEQHKKIPMSTRRKWCQQVVQSISYIHSRGVIHSDLRPENFLVHATTPESLDLWLCDFGGSFCKRLDLDGGHLPDSGFMDSKAPAVSEIYTDIFSIGSILYTIVTGHWPHGERSHLDKTPESMAKYCEHVNNIFGQGHFPETQGISGGSSILGCWTYMYATADEILKDLGMDDTKASASDIFELKPYT